MGRKLEKLKEFYNNRWVVMVGSMWVQSCAGIGYLFGSISPVIKSTMGYNQRQVAILGVSKDLGDSIGFIAGSLCDILPTWAILLIGAVQMFLGYGLVWLIVVHQWTSLPLWVLCVAIFIGTNGETYYNTAALVSCVQNFPKNRGPVVGILKGFAGLSGAILTQVYAIFNASDSSSLIFMVAVGPSMVVISLMFIVRPVGGHKQNRPSDNSSFMYIYSVCLVLAAYMMGVVLLEDLLDFSQEVIAVFVVLLIILIILPIIIPITLVFLSRKGSAEVQESLIPSETKSDSASTSGLNQNEVIFSELEDEKPSGIDLLPELERRRRMAQLQAKLFQAAAEGAVRVKGRTRPRRGEDFTLTQALVKADFWLLFSSLVLASGSGLTIVDNMGQISESLGYSDTDIFVSMISIWCFLGRVGGGYLSELIVRNYAYPRPVAMSIVEVIMALGLFFYAMAWPGAIYVLTVVIGLGYGALWAIVPAAASELFGLKSFGALYNFLTMASPAGSLIFSGVIASGIYDYEAEKQSGLEWLMISQSSSSSSLSCSGYVCYSITCGILSGLCILAVVFSLIVVYRTRSVYAQLYGKSQS
ncbi:unnamed protein product [Rhodiola kirilowii]